MTDDNRNPKPTDEVVDNKGKNDTNIELKSSILDTINKDNINNLHVNNISQQDVSEVNSFELSKESKDYVLDDNYKVPSYLIDVYNWAYIKPKNVKFLDNIIIYNTILFGNGFKLMKTFLKEIDINSNHLQIAHVYGPLVNKVLDKIGSKGHLTVLDAAPVQLEQAKKKIGPAKNVKYILQDAKDPFYGNFKTIGCYFLLHEVPDDVKVTILDNILDHVVNNNSKAIFVDYHRPSIFNPARFILSLINKTLEPFADTMWHNDIKDFTKRSDQFNWRKETYFFGTYQKVVVTKKS